MGCLAWMRLKTGYKVEEKKCDDSGSFHFDVWLKFTVRPDERLLSYIMGLIFFSMAVRLFY